MSIWRLKLQLVNYELYRIQQAHIFLTGSRVSSRVLSVDQEADRPGLFGPWYCHYYTDLLLDDSFLHLLLLPSRCDRHWDISIEGTCLDLSVITCWALSFISCSCLSCFLVSCLYWFSLDWISDFNLFTWQYQIRRVMWILMYIFCCMNEIRISNTCRHLVWIVNICHTVLSYTQPALV